MLWRWSGVVAAAAILAACAGGGPAAVRDRCSTDPAGSEPVHLFYVLCLNAP
jgi:hypothetical protein